MLTKEFNIDVHAFGGMEGLISEGRYDKRHVLVTESEFPMPQGLPRHTVFTVGFERTMSIKTLWDCLCQTKLTFSTIEKLLAFGAQYPREQLSHSIVALGSVSTLKLKYYEDYRPFAPCLCSMASKQKSRPRLRFLDTRYLQDAWEPEYRFLVERVSDTPALSALQEARVLRPMRFLKSRTA